MSDWTLVVDFGTSATTGALVDADGIVLLEVDGSTRMPSTVRRADEGALVVGAGAEGSGWAPDSVDRNPKRSLGRLDHLVLGGEPVEVTAAVAAVLAAFAAEGTRRRDGAPPTACVLTHPVRWGERRRSALVEAARRAGLPAPALLPEPVAAAHHYRDTHVTDGDLVAVYDLGGGTFDTAVLRATAAGFEPVGEPGGDPDLGGEHLDDLLFAHVGTTVAATAPEVWEQLRTAESPTWRRRAAELRREVRLAKEALSRTEAHTVHVDAAECDVRITRAELEELIRPSIEATVRELLATVERAGTTPAQLARVYLVGGASRTPLVTRLVADATGAPPTTYDEPKSVVALGAARSAAPTPPSTLAAPPPPDPARRRRRILVPAAAALVAVLVGAGATVLLTRPSTTATAEVVLAADPATPSPTPTPTPTPSPSPAPVAEPAAPQVAPAPTTTRPRPRTTPPAAPQEEPAAPAPRAAPEPAPPQQQQPARPAVTVSISGPRSVYVGQTYSYSPSVSGGEYVTGCYWTDAFGQTVSTCNGIPLYFPYAGQFTVFFTVQDTAGEVHTASATLTAQ